MFRHLSARKALVTGACMILVAVFAGQAGCSPVPQTITLKQEAGVYEGCADTWLWEYSDGDDNYGGDTEIYVRYDANYYYDRATLIKYDLTGKIPSGACIKSATLRVYQYSDHSINSGEWFIVAAYRLLKNWTEGTGGGDASGATWYYRHAGLTDPWMVQAARGVNSDTDADRHHTHHVTPPYVGVPDSKLTCTTGERWLEFDVTPSVQHWVSTPTANHGIVLDRWSEGVWSSDDANGVNLRSSEYETLANRPELVITYVIPTAEPYQQLRLSDLSLNYWNTDPNITFSSNSGQLLCSGTTSDAIWGADGATTTYSLNSSFESSVKVKLQQGIVGIEQGEFGFGIYEPATSKYIRILAIGFSAQYYEISGLCAASGNGEYHDGSAYWASYWDGYYPTYPPASPACRFFAQTAENEATDYLTWKIRYDKTNGMLYVGVNDVLVTYYSKVNLSNFRLAIMHDNNRSGVPTTVWTDFPDSTPPSPNPMTWSTQPYAASTSSISMIGSTATDADHPPVSYYFTETTGGPGGSSSGWQSGTSYSDGSLSANTQYGYKVKARDSYSTPNETADSSTVSVYTLIPAPTGCTTSSPTATTINLTATGSFPNLSLGQTGTQFETTTPGWSGLWKLHAITDTASGLTPNTLYTFHVRSRNGDAIATAYSAGTGSARTLAANPTPLAYNPVSCQAIQANWGANGNPLGTQYFCQELTTGRSTGWTTGTSFVLRNLTPGASYHFQVKARNADWVETGWVDLGVIQTNLSIGAMKMQTSPGMTVSLLDKTVTAMFETERLCFIQDSPGFTGPEGMSGIAVRLPPEVPLVKVGDRIDVVGTLTFNNAPYDQELVIDAMMIRPIAALSMLVIYGSNGTGLGGGVFGSQPGMFDDITVDPPVPAFGTSTVGMLVKAWGTVLDGGLGGHDYIWISDGARLNDGTEPGIRVSLAPIGGVIEPLPIYCSVTGVMRCVMVDVPGGGRLNVRVLWPRKADDIVEFGP